jgi:hypothetical protein
MILALRGVHVMVAVLTGGPAAWLGCADAVRVVCMQCEAAMAKADRGELATR